MTTDIQLSILFSYQQNNKAFDIKGVRVMAVSFTGGGNRYARKKAPTCGKSLTNFIT
jgi:hypothetical protein